MTSKVQQHSFAALKSSNIREGATAMNITNLNPNMPVARKTLGRQNITLAILLMVTLIVNAASAAMISRFEFGGQSPTLYASDVDVTNISKTAGTSFDILDYNSSRNEMSATDSGNPVLQAREYSGGGYDGTFSFTVTPDAGFEIDYADFSVWGKHEGSQLTITMTPSYQILDGSSSLVTLSGQTTTNNPPAFRTYDISALQGVSDPVRFDFRIQASGDTIGWFDDIRIDGEVVPEPASFALLALGGLLAFRRNGCTSRKSR